MKNKAFIKIMFIILLVTLLLGLHVPDLTKIFRGDEVDYIEAVKSGFIENYFENHSISILEMLTGSAKDYFTKGDIDVLQRMAQKNDVLYLRHIHPPFAFYFHILTYNILGDSALVQRSTILLLAIIFLFLYFFLSCRLTDNNLSFGLFFSSLCIATCPAFFSSSTSLTMPHMAYAVISFVTLWWIAKFIKSGRLTDFYISGICLSICSITSEYAVFIFFSLIATLLVCKNPVFNGNKHGLLFSWHIFLFIALMIFTSGFLWYAGIFKFKILIPYGYYAYSGLIGTYYNASTFMIANVIKHLFVNKYIALFFALVLLYFLNIVIRKKVNIFYVPFAVYLVLLLIANHKNNFIYHQYVLSFAPYLFLFSGLSIEDFLSKRKKGTARLLMCLMMAVPLTFVAHDINASKANRLAYEKEKQLIDKIGNLPLDKKRVLNLTCHKRIDYYLSDIEFIGFIDEEDDLLKVKKLISNQYYDYVLLDKSRKHLIFRANNELGEQLLQAMYSNYLVSESIDDQYILYIRKKYEK